MEVCESEVVVTSSHSCQMMCFGINDTIISLSVVVVLACDCTVNSTLHIQTLTMSTKRERTRCNIREKKVYIATVTLTDIHLWLFDRNSPPLKAVGYNVASVNPFKYVSSCIKLWASVSHFFNPITLENMTRFYTDKYPDMDVTYRIMGYSLASICDKAEPCFGNILSNDTSSLIALLRHSDTEN
jgi:hypothetical protein